MQRFRLIALSSAILIVLLHSIIPHKHHSEYSFEEHEKAHEQVTGVVDFIALAFHFDFGDGQLKEFTSSDADSFDFEIGSDIILSLPEQPLFIPVYQKKTTVFASVFITDSKQSIRKCSLRGPPSIS